MAWMALTYSPSPPVHSSTCSLSYTLRLHLHVQLCLLLLCLVPLARALSSSSTASPTVSSTGQPSNASNSSAPYCSIPHPLFASPLNIFANTTFPIASTLQPFPAASYLHHCPNLNSTVGSCCDEQSVQFAERVVDAYLDRRTRLSDGLTNLTVADLYYVLTGAPRTNVTAATNMTAHLNLTTAQQQTLSTMLAVVQSWGVGAMNCSDHWMSYLTSTFCLACDPLPRYFNQTVNPNWAPQFHLQESVCSSIFAHCSSLFFDFFEHLPQLLLLLQRWPSETPGGYNLSTEYWASYDTALQNVANRAPLELNIDLCEVGGSGHQHSDCSRLFCEGSFDHEGEFFPHAFRGLQYGVDSRTLHFVLDAHAYLANMVCTLRIGYHATSWYGAENYANRTDGCPASANLLNLLFPTQFELSPILSSSCVNGYYHEPTEAEIGWCTVPQWCFWEASAPIETALWADRYDGNTLNQSAAVEPYDYEYELCDTNGLAWPYWSNTTDLEVAWPAYEVGCRLNFSRHICQLPALPPPPPPDIVDVVDALFHQLFVVLVAVGLTVLLCVFVCLCRRYRVERAERLEARVADERSGSEMELEWEESLMAGKRKQAGASSLDGAGLATFDSPRSTPLLSSGWQ